MKETLPKSKQMLFALGALGYSILYNIISVMLIYVYLPPQGVGLNELVPNTTIFGVLTGLAIVVALGRLTDAVTDPLIAFWSDRFTGKSGRRIPFMKWSFLPTGLLCVVVFIPFSMVQSSANLWSLGAILFLFFLSMTLFLVPYNALLPELARTRKEKLIYAAYLAVAYVVGIILSAQTPFIADLFQQMNIAHNRLRAIQLAIGLLSMVSIVCMLAPVLVVNEKKHCIAKPITIPFKEAILVTLRNKNFVYFIVMEMLYFLSLSIVASGLLYYLTVLLDLPEARGGAVMGVMVLVSLFYYPMVVNVSQTKGYRRFVQSGLVVLGILMGGIYIMGNIPVNPNVQIFTFAILAAYPLAVLGILPHAIIAEIAELDAQSTGQHKEGLYYAIRNFMTKLGQTLGLFTFATLTIFGKDPDNDLGIRLSGIIGMVLCFVAVLIFQKFKESN